MKFKKILIEHAIFFIYFSIGVCNLLNHLFLVRQKHQSHFFKNNNNRKYFLFFPFIDLHHCAFLSTNELGHLILHRRGISIGWCDSNREKCIQERVLRKKNSERSPEKRKSPLIYESSGEGPIY